MPAPKISVIVCSIDAMKFARVSECYEHLLTDYPHEIIGIHDARSLAEGYNCGIKRASGDILIFSHDDILILDPGFAKKITARLQTFDILGFVGTSRLITATWFGAAPPHIHGVISHGKPGQTHLSLNVYGVSDWPTTSGIQAIDGFCMVATRETAQTVGFDATTFDGFHLYDLDFSFSAYLAGRRLGVCCDIPIIHESSGNFADQHLHYAERFIHKYIDRLGQTDASAISGESPGRGIRLQDHHALLRSWQPDLLKRATIAMRRDRRNTAPPQSDHP
ncbi:MAG: hypothetical protein C0466_10415 [Candidatus Accumulibacter sp.]|nr:hypothetical protein [Accumulibacter sp.]